MLFNSLHFLLFFPVVLIVYYNLPFRFRNSFLLVSSYYFYGSWKWEYLGLLFLSTAIDYYCGLKLGSNQRPDWRKFYLYFSLIGNLLMLGTFKYYNFFISNLDYSLPYLNVLMPVGLSFYTFQSMAYTIDVYRKEIEPERNFITFSLFISFFPQLVAGPIEKARDLLPQFYRNHYFKDVNWPQVLKLVLLGLFKKLVIADRLAPYIDSVYANPSSATSLQILLAMNFFAIQMYCDFSGYTDIARGVGNALGFDLTINFRQPFIAQNIKELLRNWHITLVKWLQSYVYFPLGGNKVSKVVTFRNYFIVMIISGFWHGANWNFLVWGVFIALAFIYIETVPDLKLPGWFKILVTMEYWSISAIFFRANRIDDCFVMLKNLLQPWTFNKLYFIRAMIPMTGDLHFIAEMSAAIFLVALMFWVDFRARHGRITLKVCYILIITIAFFGKFDEKAFVYFQF